MKQQPVGKTKEAGWQIGVSRTMPVDLETAWAYLTSYEGVATWLGDGVDTPLAVGQHYNTIEATSGEVRSIRDHDRVRLTWQPASRSAPATIQIALTRAATGTTFRFHTERLADSDEREAMRAHWLSIAAQIEAQLTD